MEPVGLGVGIAGLAGVFTACVDCFEYIQLGRNFGRDYGKCLLRLDAAKVRMTRWGASVGIGATTQLLNQITVDEQELRLAKSLLEQILKSFGDAEKVSEKYKKHVTVKKSGLDDSALYDANSDLDPEYRTLHLTLSQLALERQKETSLLKKTTWALYEKKKFDAMIDGITGFIGDLVELFPVALDNQKLLCRTEVFAVKKSRDLISLKAVACEDDEILKDTVNKEMESRGHTFTDWRADGKSKIWAGDDNALGVASKSHHFNKFSVSGDAEVRLGNTNRGN